MKNSIYSLTLFLFGVLFIFSCKDDDTPAVLAPTSDFSYEISGKTVTFTSTSALADSYSWDFGDGNTSTEASPVHTYDGNGSYVAKLTVTNVTGNDSKQAVLEIINVAIDGSFDDWASVAAATPAPTGGTITVVKFENLENNKLFIYVEGTDELTPQAQIILNLDNDVTTGALIDWWFPAAGEDILIEGSLPVNPDQFGSIYNCEPCDGSVPGGWNWGAAPINEDIASFMVASEMISIPGGFAYELVIDLTAVGQSVSSDAIGIAIMDIDLTTWAPVGNAPAFVDADTNPDAAPYLYEFK